MVTADGRRLARIWSEADLLVAECLRAGAWQGLNAAELAAAASTLVFEARRDLASAAGDPGRQGRRGGRRRCGRSGPGWRTSRPTHGVRVTRDLDLGFAWAAYRWADGQSLDRVLAGAEQAGTELSGGDFVRWARQLIDLLDQLAKVADEPVAPWRAPRSAGSGAAWSPSPWAADHDRRPGSTGRAGRGHDRPRSRSRPRRLRRRSGGLRPLYGWLVVVAVVAALAVARWAGLGPTAAGRRPGAERHRRAVRGALRRRGGRRLPAGHEGQRGPGLRVHAETDDGEDLTLVDRHHRRGPRRLHLGRVD